MQLASSLPARAGLSRAGCVGVGLFTVTLCSGLAVTWFGEPARRPAPAPDARQFAPAQPEPEQPEPPAALDPEVQREIAAYLEQSAAETNRPASQPTAPPPLDPNSAVADAVRLLLVTAANPLGQFVEQDSGQGYVLSVGETYLCRVTDGPRVAARWRTVVLVLRWMGLIEVARVVQVGPKSFPYDFTFWRLTEDGYARADALERRRER